MKNIKTGKEWRKFDVQNYPGNIREYYENKIEKKHNIMGKNTKIASMGSCFAVNIADYLWKKGYNYPMMQDEMTQNRGAPADWGAVYNIPCMKQIYKYSFEEFNPITRWWDKGKYLLDPFRRDIAYFKGQENKKFQTHKENSHKVLQDIDVMVLTLGLAEVWRDKRDKATFWRVVPVEHYSPQIHEFHIMTVEECVNDLNEIKRIINNYNPNCKLILTVSPVPFFATFRKDIDPVSANFNSKSILRVAVDQFVSSAENTYYFPAFEYIRLGFESPYKKGGHDRHISDSVINKTMQLFEKFYVKGK